MQKTLEDLLQGLADKHDSGKLPTASTTISLWIRLLNDGQRYCADRLQLEKQATLTTSGYLIALPSDFQEIVSVVRPSSGEALKRINVSQSENATADFYWITGDNVNGYVLNVNNDESFTVTYKYEPDEMESNSDVCIIEDPLAVVCYAYAKLRQSETDPLGDAKDHLNETDGRLREIQHRKIENSGGYGFTIL